MRGATADAAGPPRSDQGGAHAPTDLQPLRAKCRMVSHYDINAAQDHMAKEMLKARALHCAARESAIIVGGRDHDPAFVALAADIGLTRLALGMQRIELLFQPLLGRFAGVDRAAPLGRLRPSHRLPRGAAGCRGPRLQAEEDRSRPAGAGDRAGDLRQRTVPCLLPHKALIAYQNLVSLPLPVSQQLGSRFEAGAANAGLPPSRARPAMAHSWRRSSGCNPPKTCSCTR